MSNVKFKAYEKHSGKVLEVLEIDFQGMEILVLDHDEMEARNVVDGHYKLMQYTGLNDKNEEEIYEGYELYDTVADVEYRVVRNEGAFVVEGEGMLIPLSELHQDCEVVGNIFEG